MNILFIDFLIGKNELDATLLKCYSWNKLCRQQALLAKVWQEIWFCVFTLTSALNYSKWINVNKGVSWSHLRNWKNKYHGCVIMNTEKIESFSVKLNVIQDRLTNLYSVFKAHFLILYLILWIDREISRGLQIWTLTENYTLQYVI